MNEIDRDDKGKPMLTEVGLPPGLSELDASLSPEDIEALVALLKTFN